ncbi:MAG: glycosyltransferase family 39 protein [Gemmataceae bacterium]
MLERWLPERACPWFAAALILLAAAARVALMLAGTGLDLSPDEAHYWDWSRNPDWSYYSKGPLVAWIIRASCELLGPLSEAITGDLTFAVRAPAVLFGSVILACLYALTVQVTASPRLALGVVAAAITHPLITAGSTLMTIDSPYACCWAVALVLGLHAARTGAMWAWAATGVAVALGVLAKYTMAVFLPSFALYLLLSPERRRLLLTPGPWVMAAVSSLACVPILIWNSQHEWVTVHHVLQIAGLGPKGHANAPGGLKLMGPLNYVGGQFALMLGTWFLMWAAAVVTFRPWRDGDDGRRYLWCLSVPMFAVFLAFSVKTGGGELNWPITTYLSGGVLAACWLARHGGRWLTVPVALTCALGLSASAVLYAAPALHPAMERVVGLPKPSYRFPLRKIDPTCRLRGWRDLAAEVDRTREQVRRGGQEPVVVGTGWTLPGQLGVYCAGRPRVYSVGSLQGERLSQYDLWPNPVDDRTPFLGKTFVLVGAATDGTLSGFERVESLRTVVVEVNGRPIADFGVYVCRGFKGFPPRPSAVRH